jgi:hypothetical protein
MRNAIVAGLCAVLGFPVLSQSFSLIADPAVQTIAQGSSDALSFNLSVIPSGGYNSSVFFKLLLPPALANQAALSAHEIGNPYPAISVDFVTHALPPGVHQFSVQAYNGPLSKYAICEITVERKVCPEWFVYKAYNSPLTADKSVVTGIDASGNYWTGIVPTNPANKGSLICFDRQTWRVWSTTDYSTYNITGSLTAIDENQWITGDGVYDLCTNGDTVYALTSKMIHRVINNQMTDIAAPGTDHQYGRLKVDHLNRLWLLSKSQLHRYAGGEWTTINFGSPPFSAGLSIYDFEIDQNGDIWVGVIWYGIYKFDDGLWTAYLTSALQGGVLARAPNGTLWASDKMDLFKFDNSSNSFVKFSTPKGGCTSITFDPVTSDPVIANEGIGVYTGNSYTVYNQFNSPVIPVNPYGIGKLANIAHKDKYNNLIIADYAGGFIFRCGDTNKVVSTGDLRYSQEIRAYPNPVSDRLTIEGLNEKSNYQYALFNQLGCQLKSANSKGAATLEIDMKELAPGIYFLMLRNEIEKKFVRVIRE